MPSNEPSQRDPSEVMYRGVMGVVGFVLFAAGAAFAVYSIYALITGGFALGTLAALLVVTITAIAGVAMLRAAFASRSDDKAEEAGPRDSSRQRGVLRTARKYDGRLTLAEVSLETRLDVDEARQILDKFEMQGVAEMQISDTGQEVYVFPAFSDDGRDKLTARSPFDEDAEVELLFEQLADEQAGERAGEEREEDQREDDQREEDQREEDQRAEVSARSSRTKDDT